MKTSIFDKTWKQTSVLIQALKIKLSKELHDYKVKTVFEIERLQDDICLKGRVTRIFLREREREGLQDYKKHHLT